MRPPVHLSLETVIQTAPNQVSADLAGEAAILNLSTGVYYGLNEMGAQIWKLIQTPQKVETLYAAVQAEYDVSPEQCQQDIDRWLQQMYAAGLIEVRAAENE